MPVTPLAGYGKRTGVTTLKKLIQSLCTLYDHFRPSIEAWIDTNMTFPNTTTVKTWLAALSDICFIVGGTADD
jgi:hypothetical protein